MESENGKTQTHVVLSKGMVISHYQIIEKIGAGGMGEVYLAKDTKLNRKVALKFLPPHLCQDEDCRTRFKREAQAAAQLNHPNIVTIYEVGDFQGRPFFAMELMEGQSLRDFIEKQELSISTIINLAVQICEGLSKAHEAGIIHRDIKPSNIVMDADGRPKLLDFGLATVKGTAKLTRTGSTLGTVSYMSPEQVEGKETDQRSDIFSLGVVLYEMITGQSPFQRDTEAATMNAIVHDTPEPLARYKSDVPDDLQRIIDEALDKDLETRYQTVVSLLTDLKRLKKASESSVYARPPVTLRKRSALRFLIPGSIVILIALLLVLFKPWTFEVRPAAEAVAAENRLAIMYFDNVADAEDEQRWGEIVTNLLITDLSESHYVQVVSSQRLYDILKLLGREGEKKVDRSVATQIATKAGAKWMLLGNILQVEPQITITAQVVEVSTGNAIASQRITGDKGEDIFSLVDKLTAEIKKDLALPTEAQEEPDRLIQNVTTSSPEAYRHYLEGIELFQKFYWDDAEKSFMKALEFDSTFAVAYYHLAMFKSGSEKARLADKAMQYSDKASWKEKRSIRSLNLAVSGNFMQAIKETEKIIERYPDEKRAYMWSGVIYYNLLNEPQKAIRSFTKAIEIDPLYKMAYNFLAYAYNAIGDFDKSIWAISKYISIAPDEANPYDTRGDLYGYNGKIDEAIESYKKALQIKPDFGSLDKLGHMYLFKKEYAKAESCYQELASGSEKGTRSSGRTYLAYIPLQKGQFKEALKVLDNGLAADRMEQYSGTSNAWKHFLKASIYREMKNSEAAVVQAKKCTEILHRANPSDLIYQRDYYAVMLAENNQIEEANEVTRALKADIEKGDQIYKHRYWLAMSNIEMVQGNTEAAATFVEKASAESSSLPFLMGLFAGEVYLESGRLGEAVTELEKALSRYDGVRAMTAIEAVTAQYHLGLAYEKSGWTNKAIGQYEEFLDIWKDADPGIEKIEDAKKRLARLKNES